MLFSVQSKEQYLQFSKTPILQNFGELPFGEIPEPLKYVRPTEVTTLSNGIRVVTEAWNSHGSTVGVFVKAGSRNETQSNSGVAHLLQHLNHVGTDRRTGSDILEEFEGLGTTLHSKTEREYQTYWTYVKNNDVGKAIDLLGDITSNSTYQDN
jgi:predicted Zn-dependent peptidase